MDILFFIVSDATMRFRRNLLFIGSLCIIHFYISSLESVKLLNVSFPAEFLNWGLPVLLVWFSINYFFHLFSDFFEWRTKHLVAVHHKNDERTLFPEIVELSNDRLILDLSFRSASKQGPTISEHSFTADNLTTSVTNLMNNLCRKFELVMKQDLERINRFRYAIFEYTRIKQLRFYLLDVMTPVIVTIIGLSGIY